jgi:hypothetical protein
LTKIPNYLFVNCTALTSVEIPANVTSIGNGVFSSCTGLKTITIPANVISIGKDTFKNCTSLESLTFENASGWYVTDTSNALEGVDVVLSDPAQNITLLGDYSVGYYWYKRVD